MISDTSEAVFAYGNGFHGLFTSLVGFVSIAIRGLIPEEWRKRPPYRSVHDCVCVTVIPQGTTSSERVQQMANVNDFVDGFRNKLVTNVRRPDHILIGIVLDLTKVATLPFVARVNAYGHFPAHHYLLEPITGINETSYRDALSQGHDEALHGEIRVYFTSDQKTVGIIPKTWLGIMTRNQDSVLLQSWITELEPFIDLTQLPIFNENLERIR